MNAMIYILNYNQMFFNKMLYLQIWILCIGLWVLNLIKLLVVFKLHSGNSAINLFFLANYNDILLYDCSLMIGTHEILSFLF